MAIDNWHTLLALAIGVVTSFAVVIVMSLRFATRRQAVALSRTNASAVLAEIGAANIDRTALLYGVWQTTPSEVRLLVRDGNDTEVAQIIRGMAGTTITTDDRRYVVVTTSGWRESATLNRADTPIGGSTPLAMYERQGWAGGLASFTLADRRVFTLGVRWGLLRKRAPLTIQQDGQTVGQLFGLGGAAFNAGRALLLPPTIPLEVRLFILYKAGGTQALISTR